MKQASKRVFLQSYYRRLKKQRKLLLRRISEIRHDEFESLLASLNSKLNYTSQMLMDNNAHNKTVQG